MYFTGRHYEHDYVWIINFITQGSAFVFVSVMTERLSKALQEETLLSRTDQLTGLLNSRCFFEQLKALLLLCKRNILPLTLAYIDLDNFKAANDQLGHVHGDKLLNIVADIFKDSLRSSDLVARLGGDEFAIFLPDTSSTGAKETLEKIRRLIELNPELKNCSVTLSIGAVTLNESPDDINQLLQSADELMYKAKKAGKNQIVLENF